MIGITSSGDLNKTRESLKALASGAVYSDLDQYGRMGVDALQKATPIDTSLTANSWQYRIIKDKKYAGIEWYNTNIVGGGTPVAILLQYGHGTGTGGYVAGRDYINPAMRPIFDKIAAEVWKKVIS